MTADICLKKPYSTVLSGEVLDAARGEKSLPLHRGALVPTPAIVRTVVPMIVGALLSFLATYNVHLDTTTEHALSLGLTGLLGAVYYVVVYALETRWPALGFLLGSNARPTYAGKHRRVVSSDPATATPDAPENRL
jgi:hypothetical protein